jgi:ribosomal subunit interface protein
MNIRFTGRHVSIDPEDRRYAEEKATSLARFHRNLREVDIRVDMDGALLERVELEAGIGHHHRVVASAEAPEFRTAIDAAVDQIRRQLLRDKEKDVDRRRRAAAPKRRTGGRSTGAPGTGRRKAGGRP